MASKERVAGQTGLPLGDTDGVIVVQENQTAIRQNCYALHIFTIYINLQLYNNYYNIA